VDSLTGAVALRLTFSEVNRGRIWLYAGTSENLQVLVAEIGGSENPSSADNQQETILMNGILNDYTPDPKLIGKI